MTNCSTAVLYISYDGVLEPLGQSQVLAYLKRLAKYYDIHLVSFEKADDLNDKVAMQRMRALMELSGISWRPLRYHKSPSAFATAYDLAVGIIVVLWTVRQSRVKILHARSYVPALIALVVAKLSRVKSVFDMRGFWADERVDGGLWPSDGMLYRIAKRLERAFLMNADFVITLTRAASREIRSFSFLERNMPAIEVIPTCADFGHFRPMAKCNRNFVLGYVGSVGTWYDFDSVVKCFAQLRLLRPSARLLIVNRNEHSYIEARLMRSLVPREAVDICRASHAEMPQYINRMDAGVFFYLPSYSRLACAPTKLAEFLGCGIPCLGSGHVGDVEEILEGEGVGVCLDSFTEQAIEGALKRLIALVDSEATKLLCVKTATSYFSVESGVAAYSKIYSQLDTAEVRVLMDDAL